MYNSKFTFIVTQLYLSGDGKFLSQISIFVYSQKDTPKYTNEVIKKSTYFILPKMWLEWELYNKHPYNSQPRLFYVVLNLNYRESTINQSRF